MASLADDENVIEFAVGTAVLHEDVTLGAGDDVSTFVTLDFYDHPTQATMHAAGRSPDYDAVLQFVVPMDAHFFAYLAT